MVFRDPRNRRRCQSHPICAQCVGFGADVAARAWRGTGGCAQAAPRSEQAQRGLLVNNPQVFHSCGNRLEGASRELRRRSRSPIGDVGRADASDDGRIARRRGGRRPSGIRSAVAARLLDARGELGDLVVDRPSLLHELGDLLVRVHDRGVVAVAEELPDLRQREARELTAEVHRDLACGGDGLRTARPVEVVDRELEVVGRRRDDVDR